MNKYFSIRLATLAALMLSSCFSTSLSSSSMSSSSNTTTSISSVTTSNPSVVSSSEPSSSLPSSITLVTVTFHTNGGSVIDPESVPIHTALTELSTPLKEGFIFEGWYRDEALLDEFQVSELITDSLTLYAKWSVDIYFNRVPIATFKTGTIDTYDEIVGVVLFANLDMGLIVIADETDLIAVISSEPLCRGDLVRMGGYRQNMDGYILMGKPNEEETFMMRYLEDQPLPITPTLTSISTLLAMDPLLPANWIQYIELRGMLTSVDHQMFLEQGTDIMPVMMASQEDFEWAEMHLDFEIRMDGILVPNMEDTPPTLMFIYIGGEDHLRFDYTDEELLGVMMGYLQGYLESQSYYPGQVIDLPSTHPFLPMTVTYSIAEPNLADLDLETGTISSAITEAKTIEITATGNYLSHELSMVITLSIAPIVYITIAEFLTMPDDMTTFYYLEGVVVFLQIEHQFVMMADTTGVLYVITNRLDITQGDQIQVHGIKMSSEGLIFIANDPTMTIMQVVASNQPMPLIPTTMTLEAFLGLDALDPLYQLKYVAIDGELNYNLESNMYYLSSGLNNLPLYLPNPSSGTSLTPFIGTSVTIQGLSLRPGSESFLILVFLDFPGDIHPLTT